MHLKEIEKSTILYLLTGIFYDALYSFATGIIWIPIWYHFPSTWRISCRLSYSVNWPVSTYIFILSSFLKSILTGYRILGKEFLLLFLIMILSLSFLLIKDVVPLLSEIKGHSAGCSPVCNLSLTSFKIFPLIYGNRTRMQNHGCLILTLLGFCWAFWI